MGSREDQLTCSAEPLCTAGPGIIQRSFGGRVLSLRVSGLNVRYGKSHVVFDLDLQVGQGELVALLGRNGAGKTTTILGVVGLLPGATGRVEVGGMDVGRWPSYRRTKGHLAYVPSGARCFPNLTVQENLALTAKADGP